MKIKNFQELAKSDLRRQALEITEAGLLAVDTVSAVKNNVSLKNNFLQVKGEKIPLEGIERILVAGLGKCSYDAAVGLEEILGERLTGGIVVDLRQGGGLKKIKLIVGDHPLPTERNVRATAELISLLKGLTEKDLVLIIVSGGGSTILCQPEDLTCRQEGELLKHLFRAGANIKEINTIRKHLSSARGGNLAAYAYPAKVISLIFSDVPGDGVEFVASGPTALDTTSVREAEEIIAKYGLESKFGRKINLLETPKEEKYFAGVKNFVLVSNQVALEAMQKKAVKLGLNSEICTTCLEGEAAEKGKEILRRFRSTGSGTALLFGGETTVTVRGDGRGGRNQELVLAALAEIKEGEIILAAASDGRDNTDFAGAIADVLVKEKAVQKGLDGEGFLRRNDSYNFFSQTGGYLLTGPTGSNIADLVVAIKK